MTAEYRDLIRDADVVTISVREERTSDPRYRFVADCPLLCGTPPVGRGATPHEAIAGWFTANASTLGFTFKIEID